MGQAQQRRLAPALAAREVSEAAVVEAAAHAQAATRIIETDQRQQHQVQRPDLALLANVDPWLKDAEAIGP